MSELKLVSPVRTPLVLVVDDDADLRDIYGTLLLEHGCDVAAACNGFEALAYLRTHRAPSLILLDVRMPVMDGGAFRREQARDRALRAIPVVVVTGETRSPDLLNVAAILGKPLEAPDLIAALTRVLS